MCEKASDRHPSMLKYCTDGYKTRETCIEALEYSFPLAVRYVPDCFVKPKMHKDLDNAILGNTYLGNSNLDKLVT